MRIRKKPWTQEVINEAIEQNLLIINPEKFKGKWKKQLNTSVLHVEIGAGKGDYFVGMSTLYPDEGWVAIERVKEIGAYALRKSFGQVLNNGKFIIKDADNIQEWFREGEIDFIHLNFSDPWPKKAHNKRRLTTPQFVKTYENLLSSDGQIVLKSDNKGFFEDSVIMITKYFELIDIWMDFRTTDHPEDTITEYEQRFIDLKQPIYRAIWRKKNESKNNRTT